MAFQGWSDVAVDFFDGLEEDNSKAYWTSHKAIYEAEVKQPMESLVEELSPEFGPGKIFRPYRDVRFSADKSPYKTAIAATVGDAGYVQVSAAGLAVGSGMYMMSPDQLHRFRSRLASDPQGAELVRLVAHARAAGWDITAHDSVKSAPRGYAKDHPRIDLLRLKGCIAWKQWPVEPWLATPKAAGRIAAFFRDTAGLNRWLDDYVGPAQPTPTD